jgi:hypothetical protein
VRSCDVAELEEVRSSGLVFFRGGGLGPAADSTSSPSARTNVYQRPLPLVGTAYGLDGATEVGEHLRCFQRRMSSTG